MEFLVGLFSLLMYSFSKTGMGTVTLGSILSLVLPIFFMLSLLALAVSFLIAVGYFIIFKISKDSTKKKWNERISKMNKGIKIFLFSFLSMEIFVAILMLILWRSLKEFLELFAMSSFIVLILSLLITIIAYLFKKSYFKKMLSIKK